jgi:CheY-like chemotaxis protein/anti-sigma regulatory factor (Ser/Thr protein kinase)
VEAALDAAQPAAQANGVELERRLSPAPLRVFGDPARLQQVVSNLVSNAIKFTPAGGKVEVRLDAAGQQARLQVRDTGAGIDPEFLPHVFEGFRQADTSSTRANRGLGLGLALVRNLVELHRGVVEAESEGEGKGSTFTVRLPLTEGEDREAFVRTEQERLEPATLEGLRVLVVDDDRDTREVLRVLLEQWGAEVTAVASADEALAVISALDPHVLLSDIAMPGQDGYALIRQVRAREEPGSRSLPAAALTAYASREDRARALGAGYHDHIAKPVEPKRLVAVVARLAGRAVSA